MFRPTTISKRKVIVLAVTLLSLVTTSCFAEPTQPPTATAQSPQITPAATTPLTAAATLDINATISAAFASTPDPGSQSSIIPADVSYSVIDTDIVSGIKRSLDVRLNKKVSENALRAIALKLRAGDSREYDRTFIVYYLPGMPVGAGGWATTHFDPTLDVRILGLTVQEERALVTESVTSVREVIGRWLDEFSGSQISIYREGGTLFVEQKFKDGSVLKEELVEKPSTLGRRFDNKQRSSFGDHRVIDRAGDLQIRDNVGLISTAKRIK